MEVFFMLSSLPTQGCMLFLPVLWTLNNLLDCACLAYHQLTNGNPSNFYYCHHNLSLDLILKVSYPL